MGRNSRTGAAHPYNADNQRTFSQMTPATTATVPTTATSVKWRHNWRVTTGSRPVDATLFHSYVEEAYKLLEECNVADFLYHDVKEVCQPQYLFSVVSDMTECKLSMKIHNTESGLRVITIHKV